MAHFPHNRHVRRRKYSRLRSQSGRTKKFLAERSSTLTSTASGQTFTADDSTDVCTATGHGFTTANGPVVLTNSGGALPAGLAVLTSYWPIRVDDDTFKLALTRKLANAGTAVNITGTGTGTHTIKRQATAGAMLERQRAGLRPRTLKAATDIDNLA